MWRRISFSAEIEELGLLFGIGILLTAAVLFVLMIRLAGGLADGFYRNLVVGFAILYLFQTFLTVGGGSKFIPLTGVTLPLVSYGGSSVMTDDPDVWRHRRRFCLAV